LGRKCYKFCELAQVFSFNVQKLNNFIFCDTEIKVRQQMFYPSSFVDVVGSGIGDRGWIKIGSATQDLG
jgi:hypothetical protein